jgi:putative lipoprotein
MSRSVALCLALLVVACGGRPESPARDATIARVTGTATYRDGVALPPDAELRVRVEDVSRADARATVVGQETVRSVSAVPIAFAVPYDPARIEASHRYAVRAEIRNGAGDLLWTTTEAYPALTHGAPTEIQIVLRRADLSADQEPRRTLVYECVGLDVVVRQGAGEVALYLPERTVVAPQVQAASGAKYAGGDVVFWSTGDEATLDVGGRSVGPCRLVPARAPWEDARLRGVTFRAVGNEPGWFLEIDAQRIAFTGDYGDTVVSTPLVEPQVDATTGQTTYHAVTEAHDLEIVVDDKPCSDGMSDQEYPAAVSVRLDGKTFRGCGRRLT